MPTHHTHETPRPSVSARLKLLLAVTAVGLCLPLAVIVGRERLLGFVLGPIERAKVDFATLVPPKTPNRYLVCPPGLCAAGADAKSPVYAMSAAALETAWRTMIAGQSRIEELDATPGERQYDLVQSSALFGFPDTVTVKFVALTPATSTLAIYSRSHYGFSDLGANKRRVRSWLAQLSAPVAQRD